MSKTIILDLDDTLIDTSHLYWTVKEELLTLISKLSGVNKNVLEISFEEIENKNTVTYGHSPERYKHSAIELCINNGINVHKEIEKIALRIKNENPLLIEGAIDLLEYLSGKYNLTLITRGENDLQKRKIFENGLNKYFNDENTKIVPTKNVDVFKDFIYSQRLRTDDCIVIGDSIKSDINPAIECGIEVIHYKYKHEHYEWQQDKEDTEHDFPVVNSLSEIKELI